MTGLAGISCFFFQYARTFSDDRYKNMAYEALERILQAIEKGFSHPSFSTGLAGIHWTFKYLGRKGFISPEEADSLTGLTPMFEKYARQQFKSGEYDVLHGALGMLVALDIMTPEGYGPAVPSPVKSLIRLTKKELSRLTVDMGRDSIAWETTNPVRNYKELNFGLAHGIPSILLVLSWIFRITGDHAVLTGLIEPGVNYLLNNSSVSLDDLSFFPVRIKNGKAQVPSRMAWCYGDPGAAMALIQIAGNCSRTDWQSIAISILEKASHRLTDENTRVSDACICHGSAGLGLLYYAAGLKSGYELFFDTARTWIRTTIDFADLTNSRSAYLFKRNSNGYLPNYSLLEGISGTGLTLMAMLDGELPGWEKGFMIG